jgi:hypothetical protein
MGADMNAEMGLGKSHTEPLWLKCPGIETMRRSTVQVERWEELKKRSGENS